MNLSRVKSPIPDNKYGQMEIKIVKKIMSRKLITVQYRYEPSHMFLLGQFVVFVVSLVPLLFCSSLSYPILTSRLTRLARLELFKSLPNACQQPPARRELACSSPWFDFHFKNHWNFYKKAELTNQNS